MKNKEGFYMVESLNNSNTRIALVWHNTKPYRYGNETVSKEVVDVIKLDKVIGKYLTRLDMDNLSRELMQRNNIKECAVDYGRV